MSERTKRPSMRTASRVAVPRREIPGVVSPVENPLVRKLATFTELPGEAAAALAWLQQERRAVDGGRDLIAQNKPYPRPATLIEGAAIRYKILPDGRRQIVNFVLPGDVVGLRGLLSHHAFNSVTTLGRCVVAPFEGGQLMDVQRRFPMIGALIFWLSALEHTMLAERLVMVGRGTAYERLGYLLLEIWERLDVVGLTEGPSFTLPVGHQLLADTMGLSPVHVSRTLKRLRQDGLATVDHGRVVLHDAAALATISDFETGYLSRFRSEAVPKAY